MSPPPRPATPAEPLELIDKRAASLKNILSVFALVATLAASFALWIATRATTDDVAREHDSAAAALAPVAAEVRVLAVKQAAVDEAITNLKSDTAWMRAQLTEITKAVGARPVPPPQP